MYTHNLDPIILEFGVISLRWYSLSYVAGILFGWWYGKKIISRLNAAGAINFSSKFLMISLQSLSYPLLSGGD